MISIDLLDFFHQFIVSRARARRNHLQFVLTSDEARQFKAYSEALGERVVPCFGSLAMGDSWAVEFAQAAHASLLRRQGLRTAAEAVIPGRPLPRSTFLDILQIDDHVGIEVVAAGARGTRADKVFAAAATGYHAAQLPVNTTKQVRNQAGGTVLGALLTTEGSLSAPPPKVLVLIEMTFRVFAQASSLSCCWSRCLGLGSSR